MDGVIHDSVVSRSIPAAVNSELLCFIADRCHILAVDDLVKICGDFYAEDEIVTARDLINSLFSKSDGLRLPKRTRQDKADKAPANVDDIVKGLLGPVTTALCCQSHSAFACSSYSL